MPLPSNDRALRRLVADLALAPREDIDAVLDELEPRHRQAVQSLVAELLGSDADAVAREDEGAAAAARRLGLSPWLASLVTDGVAQPERSGHAMPGVGRSLADFTPTPTALAALRACVAELEPVPAQAMESRPQGWWKLLRSGARASGR